MDRISEIIARKVYRFTIPGDPIAWCRAGLGRGRFYDKQKHEKLVLGITVSQQFESSELLTKPLHLDATFYFKIPKTHFKKRNQMMGTPMPYTPDVDNLLKFICDSCAGVLYKDDALVTSVSSRKIWGEESKTEFSFSEIE